MARIRYLLSNINVMNVLLAAVLLVAAYFTFLHSPSVKTVRVKQTVKKVAPDKKSAGTKKAVQDDKTPFPTDYAVIAEQNLFHPDRKIPEKKEEKKPGPPEPKPDFVLDGVIVTGDMKIAFMEDKKQPVNTPGRPNRQTPLKIGESMSGYMLMEIDEDKVVMRKGDDRIVVDLINPKKTREHVSTGPAPAQGAPKSPASRPVVKSGPASVQPRQESRPARRSFERHNRGVEPRRSGLRSYLRGREGD